jgi:hypothetical protein
MIANEKQFIAEIKLFERSGQLPLLARVISNIALHFGLPVKDLPRVLWKAGLTMKEIEKQMTAATKRKNVKATKYTKKK